MKAVLALEDGSTYYGRAVGAVGESWGEVVFNTGMTGYECVITDPSYCGQIVVMTYPLIGNYGVCEADFEAAEPKVRGFIARDICSSPSNWRSSGALCDLLVKHGVVGLVGVDTRAITRRLRTAGTMKGIIAAGDVDGAALVERAKELPDLSDQDFISQVTGAEICAIPGSGPRIGVLDFGAKGNIVKSLLERGCEVIVFPAKTPPSVIEGYDLDGLLLSNGPGDPAKVGYGADTARYFAGKLPMMGICLGHQILAISLGAKTYKLKFGHRGSNHPVMDLRTRKIYITTHNHGFSVDEQSIEAAGLLVTHRSLNDGTVEGFAHPRLPIMSVQFHPEAAPGPKDANGIFDDYLALMWQEAI